MRVILILADGMRPDAIAELPSAKKMAEHSTYTLHGQTVFPSITLPCHMSLFHSVEPERHGTTTNTYAPQVRPVDGLFDVLHKNGKYCGMYYDWEEFRDLCRPGALTKSYLVSQYSYGWEKTNDMVTDSAVESLKTEQLDFLFIYLSAPDCAGHDHKWMSEEYMQSLDDVWKNIDRILDAAAQDDVVIVTADHGGHGRSHGTLMTEDMEIPCFIMGPQFDAGKQMTDFNLMDIAPTVCKLFGLETPKEWQGKTLL